MIKTELRVANSTSPASNGRDDCKAAPVGVVHLVGDRAAAAMNETFHVGKHAHVSTALVQVWHAIPFHDEIKRHRRAGEFIGLRRLKFAK